MPVNDELVGQAGVQKLWEMRAYWILIQGNKDPTEK